MRWAAARWAAWPTCCPRTATWPIPQHRAEVAALWGVPSVPEKPGKTAVEMFQAAADGEIKVLWIACTNPAQSMPDQAMVRRALERAEFVIVQEAFSTTATCDFADLLLPATTWGEKDGTVTNSERRISRVRPAIPAPGRRGTTGASRSTFARRLERPLSAARQHLFPYESPESIWNEHRESTRGRDLDITGLSYPLLEQAPRSGPSPGRSAGKCACTKTASSPPPTARRRFAATPYKPPAEVRESRYPFSLNTGRLRDQWHGMSRTGTLGRLFGHVPEPAVQMHPQDMARRQLAEGDLVHVTSKRGSIVVPVQASADIGLSQAFIAMHWGEEYLSGCSSTGTRLAGVNALTTSASCPTSKQPELKHAAVKIVKAELPWSVLAWPGCPTRRALRSREQLRGLMGAFPVRHLRAVRARAHRPAVPRRRARGAAARGAGADRGRAAAGGRRGAALRRSAKKASAASPSWSRVGDDQRLEASCWPATSAPRPGSAPCCRTSCRRRPTAACCCRRRPPRRPVAVQQRGRQVCTCFNVREDAIQAVLQQCPGDDAERLAACRASCSAAPIAAPACPS
jgi:assimilatory nitrate reductase catalytic subunit